MQPGVEKMSRNLFSVFVMSLLVLGGLPSASEGTVGVAAEPSTGQETLEVMSLMANAMLIPFNVSHATENGNKWLGATGLALGLTTSVLASQVEIESGMSNAVVLIGAVGAVSGLLSLARTANPKEAHSVSRATPSVSIEGTRMARVVLRWRF